MKAIIIAAGEGKRLLPITESLPKCLAKVDGISILEHITTALKKNNIGDITTIVGHNREKLQSYNYKTIINENYKENNILLSLMHAQSEMNDDCIISYSDIIYSSHIVSELVNSKYDLSVVVDTNWRDRYIGRKNHPITEAEKVKYDSNGQALVFGKHVIDSGTDNVGEFIGLCKISNIASNKFIEHFNVAQSKFSNSPFFEAKKFEKAYLTDMFNYLLKQGMDINIVPINKGWIEIDTLEDLEGASRWLALNSNEEKRVG